MIIYIFSLGKEMESALSDENRAGLSPPIIAIKVSNPFLILNG